MTRLAFILAFLLTAPWEEAETVEVKDRGTVYLKSFDCQDITRSSLINRVCYDAEGRRMLVQRYVAYQQYCDVPRDTLDAFLNAPSMGRSSRPTSMAATEPGVTPVRRAPLRGSRSSKTGLT